MSSNLYKAWIDILKCSDNRYYTGKSQALETRIEQHQQGTLKGYTFNRRPVVLMWSAGFLTYKEAIMCERQIKGWSRAKKEALIKGDIDSLRALAACRNKTHYRNKK